jgi:hypothetical protein
MRWLLLFLVACHSDVRYVTHAFVAPERCGQGPYDVHLKADGTMGSEGVEVIACTPQRLSGHVEMTAGYAPYTTTFGDHADNARCVGGGGPIVATAGAGSGSAAPALGGPGGRAASPVLVEQAYDGHDAIGADELCAPYHLPAETLMMTTMVSTEMIAPGGDLHVRIWSDAPNDLEGVVFLVRHAISTHTKAEEKKEDEEYQKKHAHDPVVASSKREPEEVHGPPPPPLAEERPPQPFGAAWVPGYWTWLGTQWGWTSGFWRDDRVAMPAPRVEVPGLPPVPAAIWIAGSWQLHAGAWVWIGGRWRR